MTSRLDRFMDKDFRDFLALHPRAPSVRFCFGPGHRGVAPTQRDAAAVRELAHSEQGTTREGPGYVAAIFYDAARHSDACVIARK